MTRMFWVFVSCMFLFACGGGGNAPNNKVTAAEAGSDQSVIAGNTVQLDGSKSTGADGSLITYQWSFISKPAGSVATITNQSTVNPMFTADLAGQYSIKLTVTDSKSVISEDEIMVAVTAASANAAPVANAGTGQSVVAGAVVTLDGSASSDANSDPLTYSWAFTSKPAGSSATLSSTTVAKPTFTADAAGTYVFNLVVNDGKINSTSATVTVTASVANAAPVANAGAGQSIVAGAVVTLDGSSSSDANSDPLTYSWAFTSKPAGSSATLSSATAAKPTFTADVAGAYVFNLVVNDGKINSASTTVTVTATDPKRLNVSYVARNGLTVTLTAFTAADTGTYYNYTVNYTQKNNTSTPIDEGQVKLYFTNSAAQPQYGFFNKLYPGDTQSRSYTFKVLYTETPSILEFDHDNFFASSPISGSLQWVIPIPN